METIDKQSIIKKFETEVVRQQERLKVVDEKILSLQKELGLTDDELTMENIQQMADKASALLAEEEKKLASYLEEYEQLG